MKNYIVLSKEFTGDANESSVIIVGNYPSFEMAKRKMDELKEKSLKDFNDEYVSTETDMCVSFKFKDDDNYRYEIEIVRFDCEEMK